MLDYLKRILIVALMALCVTIIIFGGRAHAAEFNIKSNTKEWYFPAEGEISDVFDSRGGIHKGLDIAGKYKSAVFAAADGEVVRSYYSQSYGNVIFIHHTNGFETVYAHLHSRNVKEGIKVKKGDKIGLMGNTGNSTGTHLHFEIHEGEWNIEKENAVDPFLVFGKGEIGQFVFALNHDPYGVIDVAGKMKENSNMVATTAKPIVDRKMYIRDTLNNVSNSNFIVNKSVNKINKDHDKNVKNKQVYIVKPGDTLSKISRSFKVSLNQLQEWNNLEDRNLIIPKQKIIINHQ